jgi:hypothetical protein
MRSTVATRSLPARADLVLAPTPAAVKALQNRGKPARVMLAARGRHRSVRLGHPARAARRASSTSARSTRRGVRVLVRAMASIIREVDARLVLAGTFAPKFEASLQSGIRELGLTDKVEVLGPVDHDQLPALLATASVCVVPAASDLTPNPTVVYPTKILEYMACRRAIVAASHHHAGRREHREALLFEPAIRSTPRARARPAASRCCAIASPRTGTSACVVTSRQRSAALRPRTTCLPTLRDRGRGRRRGRRRRSRCSRTTTRGDRVRGGASPP